MTKSPARMALAEGLILIGKIGAPQGIRGAVRIQVYTDDPMKIKDYNPLEDENGASIYITPISHKGNILIAQIIGITTRTEVEALKDTLLYTSREKMPPLPANEFYHTDLIGLTAKIDQKIVGTVKAVENYGAGMLLEISPLSGAAFLIPFTTESVPSLCLEQKFLELSPVWKDVHNL